MVLLVLTSNELMVHSGHSFSIKCMTQVFV